MDSNDDFQNSANTEQSGDEAESKRATDALETGRILLDTIKGEYEAELERVGSFETRAGILMTLLSTLLVYEAASFTVPSGHTVHLASVIVTAETVSMIAVISAIIFTIKVLLPMDFVRLNPERYNNLETFIQQPVPIMLRIIDAYSSSVKHASEQLLKRVAYFNWAIWLSLVGIVALVISRILQMYRP